MQKAGTKLRVYGIDSAGLVGPVNEVIVLDKTAPSIPTVNPISDKSKEVTGISEALSIVYVQIGSKLYSITADGKGNYKVVIPIQKAGTKLKVYAVDAAKNMSTINEITVLDKTAPVVPTINAVTDLTTMVYGKTEAYAIVKLYIAGKYQRSITADRYGTYKSTIAKQKASTEIKVTANDKAGNISAARIVKVIDKTPPGVPTVSKVTYKSRYITGKAEKGATVYIYKSKTFIGKGVSDSRGNFSIKITAQKKGTLLTIYAKDRAGNQSNKKSVKVY